MTAKLHRLRDMIIGGAVVAGLVLVVSLACHAPPDPNLKGAADHARDVVTSTDSTLAREAIAQRDSARATLAYALAHRGASPSRPPSLPPAPPANAIAPDTLAWCFRLVDYHQTIALNLARDTLRLGLVADSAISAAQRFERASLTDSTRADSLRRELLALADSADQGAETIGQLRHDLKRAYGTRVGLGANVAAVQQTFTSVAGVSLHTRKRVLFLEVEARAVGGYGFGGDAAKREVRGGLGGAAQVTVTF